MKSVDAMMKILKYIIKVSRKGCKEKNLISLRRQSLMQDIKLLNIRKETRN